MQGLLNWGQSLRLNKIMKFIDNLKKSLNVIRSP